MADTPTIQEPLPAADAEGGDLDLGYQVAIDQFSGPLDLLLYLVKRTEVDIVDIPLATITDQFVATLAAWTSLDLDVAGDFIVMAAALIELKARQLVPPPERSEGEAADIDAEDDFLDPRADLIKRLLEYRRFKDAALLLDGLEADRAGMAIRVVREAIPEDPATEPEVELTDLDVHHLYRTFEWQMARISGLGPRRVVLDEVSIDVRIQRLIDHLQNQKHAALSLLMREENSRSAQAGVLVASLEIVRQRFAEVHQLEQYGDADLRWREPEERAISTEFPPEEVEPAGRRRKRPPLQTFIVDADAAPVDEIAEAAAEEAEARVETDEQRFLRELDESCNLSQVLATAADVEGAFISQWQADHAGELPPTIAVERAAEIRAREEEQRAEAIRIAEKAARDAERAAKREAQGEQRKTQWQERKEHILGARAKREAAEAAALEAEKAAAAPVADAAHVAVIPSGVDEAAVVGADVAGADVLANGAEGVAEITHAVAPAAELASESNSESTSEPTEKNVLPVPQELAVQEIVSTEIAAIPAAEPVDVDPATLATVPSAETEPSQSPADADAAAADLTATGVQADADSAHMAEAVTVPTLLDPAAISDAESADPTLITELALPDSESPSASSLADTELAAPDTEAATVPTLVDPLHRVADSADEEDDDVLSPAAAAILAAAEELFAAADEDSDEEKAAGDSDDETMKNTDHDEASEDPAAANAALLAALAAEAEPDETPAELSAEVPEPPARKENAADDEKFRAEHSVPDTMHEVEEFTEPDGQADLLAADGEGAEAAEAAEDATQEVDDDDDDDELLPADVPDHDLLRVDPTGDEDDDSDFAALAGDPGLQPPTQIIRSSASDIDPERILLLHTGAADASEADDGAVLPDLSETAVTLAALTTGAVTEVEVRHAEIVMPADETEEELSTLADEWDDDVEATMPAPLAEEDDEPLTAATAVATPIAATIAASVPLVDRTPHTSVQIIAEPAVPPITPPPPLRVAEASPPPPLSSPPPPPPSTAPLFLFSPDPAPPTATPSLTANDSNPPPTMRLPSHRFWLAVAALALINVLGWLTYSWFMWVPRNILEITPPLAIAGDAPWNFRCNLDVIPLEQVGQVPELPPQVQPAVPGSWQWADMRTLRFTPSVTLPPNFTVLVTIPIEAVRTQYRLRQGQDLSCALRTPPLRAQQAQVLAFSEDGQNTIDVAFDGAVEPQQLRDRVTVIDSDGVVHPAVVISAARAETVRLQVGGHDVVPAPGPAQVALLPTEPGPQTLESPLRLDASWRGDVTLGHRLHVTEVTAEAPARGDTLVHLTIDHAEVDRTLLLSALSVEPAVEFTAAASDTGVTLRGNFNPGVEYTVRVAARHPNTTVATAALAAYPAASRHVIIMPDREPGLWLDGDADRLLVTGINCGTVVVTVRGADGTEAARHLVQLDAGDPNAERTLDLDLAALLPALPLGSYAVVAQAGKVEAQTLLRLRAVPIDPQRWQNATGNWLIRRFIGNQDAEPILRIASIVR